MEISFFDSDLFSYVILPLLIFCARICDVSIRTMRIIFVSKGKKNIAPFPGSEVEKIYTIVPRNDLKKVLEIINDFNPKAFYSIEDVRSTSEGIFPSKRSDTVFLFQQCNKEVERR